MNYISFELEHLRCSFDRIAASKNPNRKYFEQEREPRMLSSPRNNRGLHSPLLAVARRDTSPNTGFKQRQIQMLPGAFRRQVRLRTSLLTIRAGQLASSITELKLHQSPFRVDAYLGQILRVVQF